MSTLTRDDRIELALWAEIAINDAEMVRARTSPLMKKLRPVEKAIQQYRNLYGPDAGPDEHFEVFAGLVVRNGGRDIKLGEIREQAELLEERAEAAADAAEALGALNDAMHADRHEGTILEWVGASAEEFDAVRDRLIREAVERVHAEKLASGEYWQCPSCAVTFQTARWRKPASGRCHECVAPGDDD
jgi:hypothetical protein